MVAIIVGGISAEMERAVDTEDRQNALLDYVYFSLQIHKIDPALSVRIMFYMNHAHDSNEVHPFMQEFLDFLNE